jgi:hypothetical protein
MCDVFPGTLYVERLAQKEADVYKGSIIEGEDPKITQIRKHAITRARTALRCLETNADPKRCLLCKSMRMCQEVRNTQELQ